MNSLSKFEVDARKASIDLSGLEKFLEPPKALEAVQESEREETETEVIYRLLDQLYKVGELVTDTSQRLEEAHTRLTTLTALVTLQSKQLEILSHYQTQAAKVSDLEQNLAIALAENEKLKRSSWRKILFWNK
jgi:hypothetical protein